MRFMKKELQPETVVCGLETRSWRWTTVRVFKLSAPNSLLTFSLSDQVNGVDLRGASHEEAIAALRHTPAMVRLTVLRDEAQYRDEENLDVFKVELQKKSGRGLGLSIVGKRSALKNTSITCSPASLMLTEKTHNVLTSVEYVRP